MKRVLEQQGVELLRALTDDQRALLPGWAGPTPADNEMLAIWRAMLTTRLLDDRMMKLQRQGRVAFVGTATGLEAAIHGSAAAFAPADWIFSGLREGGAAVQRGMPVTEYVAHMFGNREDTAKGRQMPNHFQCREVNFASWSSVIGTQLPHAAGVALAFKRRGERNVVGAYGGDGATSSSGFHSALNFAAVWKAPVIFVIIDNGWAISVPSAKQTAARSFGAKAKAYGMPGVDVDGNDFIAVFGAARAAVERARAGDGPSLICLRSYRIGGHSSSDDPTRYREQAEVEYWAKRDPLTLAEAFLQARGLLTEELRTRTSEELGGVIAAAVERAEAAGPPSLESLVEDVYATPSRHLTRQVVEALRIRDEQGEAEKIEGKFPL